jgi:tetratricopeptide (TPR) repeat protein
MGVAVFGEGCNFAGCFEKEVEMKEKSFEEMLDLICHELDTSSKDDQAAYTMLLGAGFSYGVIPTAKEILIDAPVWLYKKRNNKPDAKSLNTSEITRNFWIKVQDRYKQDHNGLKLEFDKDSGFPKDDYISAAYKLLMSVDCPGGLTTPALRRDYIRDLCQSSSRKNNPAHLYLACLLNQQKKHKLKYGLNFCKTILTTNFDPLLQDAMQLVNVLYYMSDRPEVLDYLQEDSHEAIHLVYTHGSIHRYRLLNSEDEIKEGEKNSSSLKSHFEQHGVIVMGYGGWKDATMKALQEANQFDRNLYWCVRNGDTISKEINELLESHSACAFKVIISNADEAMNKIFERLTGSQLPEFLDDPIGMIIEQMDGLSFTESKMPEPKSEETISKSGFSDNYNSQIENSVKRLRMARETYINPEKYRSEDVDVKQPGESKVLVEELEDMKVQAVASKYIDEAYRLIKSKEIIKAIDLLSKVLDIPGVPAKRKARILIIRGLLYGELKPPKTEEEIADYTAVIEMPDVSVEQKARALINRGVAYGELKPPKIEERIADYTAVIEMPDVPVEKKARAFINRGVAYGELNPPKIEERIADYTTVIEMPDVPSEQKAKALINRGITYGKLKPRRVKEEIADYTAVIEMPDVPVEQKARALFNRGVAYGELKPPKIEEQIADYTAAIEMPDVPAEQKARVLIARGLAYSELKPPKTKEGIADYTAVIETPDAPAEQKATALIARAAIYSKLEPRRPEEGIADYTAVIEMPDELKEQKEIAHGNLGLLCFKERNDIQRLLEEANKALEYGDNYAWRYNLGLTELFLGKSNEALEHCLSAINECDNVEQLEEALELLKEKENILPKESRSAYEEIINKLEERKKSLNVITV